MIINIKQHDALTMKLLATLTQLRT